MSRPTPPLEELAEALAAALMPFAACVQDDEPEALWVYVSPHTNERYLAAYHALRAWKAR